ncbi:MAG: hypothetical protein ACM3YO_05625 [Bacteroidota bacterium]
MNEIQIHRFGEKEIEAVSTPGGLLLSDEQIGSALGYKHPCRSIAQLVARHAQELEGLSVILAEQRLWTKEGVMALCFLARTKKAMEFRKWARTTLFQQQPSELERFAELMNRFIPALAGKLGRMDERQGELEERVQALEVQARRTDPRAIEERIFVLHQLKRVLMEGTAHRTEPVTHMGYWRTLKEHVKISSFQNRAALDVYTLDRAVEFARNWCLREGIEPWLSKAI